MSDKELNRVIEDQDKSIRIKDNKELAKYFITFGGFCKPSWLFMDRIRMIQIFNLGLSKKWISDENKSLILDAITKLNETAH